MKTSSRTSIVIVFAMALIFGFVGLNSAQAAIAPDLGDAESFSVLGATSVTNAGTTTLSGDVGVSPGTSITDAGTLSVDGATHNNTATAISAQADALAADSSGANNLESQANTGGTLGALDSLVLIPGVYDMGAGSLGGGVLTLNGEGVYIFRASSSFVSAGSVRLINGARACDVFWHVETLATISGGSFVGTIIAGTGVHFTTSGTSLNGRALAIGGDVTMIGNTISGPTCTASANASTDIEVKKTASDYKLSSGPKKVTFTYKVTNESDTALTDISVKDDECDDVDYVSGDDDDDDELDVDEEWKYTCEKTVKKTETNTVTAKGTANGERVKDTDTAKVVVSVPGLPSAGLAPDNSLWGNILAFFLF